MSRNFAREVPHALTALKNIVLVLGGKAEDVHISLPQHLWRALVAELGEEFAFIRQGGIIKFDGVEIKQRRSRAKPPPEPEPRYYMGIEL